MVQYGTVQYSTVVQPVSAKTVETSKHKTEKQLDLQYSGSSAIKTRNAQKVYAYRRHVQIFL